MSALFATLALLLVATGILGAFLPGLPGAALVLAGLCWLDGFEHLGFGLLVVLVILTLLLHSIDPLATTFGAKRLGASRREPPRVLERAR